MNNSLEHEPASGEFEKYATAFTWSLELGISDPTITKRMTDKESIQGRDRSGRISKFYAEVAVRAACEDLLQTPIANQEGFFELEKDGEVERYGTLQAWGNKLCSASPRILRRRLSGQEGIDGRNSQGIFQKKAFYGESSMRLQCPEFFQEHPKADDMGFFRRENQMFGTIAAWSRLFGFSKAIIKLRLGEREGITGIFRGEVMQNRFYPEEVVRAVLYKDFEEKKLPELNASGFVFLPGERGIERYGCMFSWTSELKISHGALSRRLTPQKSSIQGKDRGGRATQLYAESIVREVCKDLLSPSENGK